MSEHTRPSLDVARRYNDLIYLRSAGKQYHRQVDLTPHETDPEEE